MHACMYTVHVYVCVYVLACTIFVKEKEEEKKNNVQLLTESGSNHKSYITKH